MQDLTEKTSNYCWVSFLYLFLGGVIVAYSNYSGWLLKVGDYIIPTNRFVQYESYKASAYMQDLDVWTDENGYIHRDAVDLKALKVEFETPPMLTDEDLSELMYNIDQNLIEAKSNSCMLTAYVPRYNQYFTQKGYMADIDPQIVTNADGKIKYSSIRFAFIGGVYDG